MFGMVRCERAYFASAARSNVVHPAPPSGKCEYTRGFSRRIIRERGLLSELFTIRLQYVYVF